MSTLFAIAITEGTLVGISVVSALAGGLLIGFFWGRGVAPGVRKRIDKAVREATEIANQKAEEEKQEISRDVNEQLLKVRDSIVQTVTAYSCVTKTISDRLPTPPELTEGKGQGAPLVLELRGKESLSEPIDIEEVKSETAPDNAEEAAEKNETTAGESKAEEGASVAGEGVPEATSDETEEKIPEETPSADKTPAPELKTTIVREPIPAAKTDEESLGLGAKENDSPKKRASKPGAASGVSGEIAEAEKEASRSLLSET
jgi:hypothetical protein